jgi:hypothetical protein
MIRQGYLTGYLDTNGCETVQEESHWERKDCYPNRQGTNKEVVGKENMGDPTRAAFGNVVCSALLKQVWQLITCNPASK